MSAVKTRQLRVPVPDFGRLALATKTVPAGLWHNLRWEVHAHRKGLFFVSPAARLTPAGGTIPCLYLSSTERTCFQEIYGDRLSAERERGRTPLLQASDFVERVFLEVDAPPLLLADLTTGAAIDALHLDLGTLYAVDTDYPRRFAQAIFDHPTKVDGILYESRHTKEPCAVIWCARTPALADVPFVHAGSLARRSKLAGGTAMVFGHTVIVAS